MADESLLEELLLRLEDRAGAESGVAAQVAEFDDPQFAALLESNATLETALDEGLHALAVINEIVSPPEEEQALSLPELPGCRVQGELGSGGMSIVYEAWQERLARKVAVKVLQGARFASKRTLERFRREAETVARLEHPNIVPIYETGECEGVPYLILEHLAGGTLKARIAKGLPTAREAAELVRTLAEAVAYSHRQQVIHRDLKPTNVLFTESGAPKIADFGLAKLLDDDGELTRTGEAPGTPNYMSPEQAGHGPIGPWTDIHALGTILYELLTGRPPFSGETAVETLIAVRTREAEPLRRAKPEVSRDLEAICLRCLEKEPSKRYRSAEALADDLGRWLEGYPIEARRAGWAQRTAKWSRRNPATAALAAVMCVGLVSLFAATWWHNRTLSAALDVSERLRADAQASETRALANERRLRKQVYVATIRSAHDAWKNENAKTVLDVLARYGPGTEDDHLRGFEWDYLQSLCKSDQRTIEAHERSVNSVQYFADGGRLISGSDDGTAKVWDAESGRLLHLIDGHQACVNTIRFAPNGEWFATASCDRSVKVWDAETYAQIASVDDLPNAADGLAISPDGSKIAVGLRFETRVADEDEDTVLVFEADGLKPACALQGHTSTIGELDYSPDGTLLAGSSADGTVSVWDSATGELVQRLFQKKPRTHVNSLVFAPARDLLVIGRRDSLRHWSTVDRDDHTRALLDGVWVNSVAASLDGRVAIATNDHNVMVWEPALRERITFRGHTRRVQALGFAPDGETIASADTGGAIKVWATDNDRSHWRLTRMPLSALNTELTEVATRFFDDDVATMSLRGERNGILPQFHERWVTFQTMVYSRDDRLVAGGDSLGTLVVWDRTSRSLINALVRPGFPILQIAFTPSGERLVLRSHTQISLVEIDSLQPIWTTPVSESVTAKFAVHPDGRTLAVPLHSGEIRMIDLETGEPLERINPVDDPGRINQSNLWPELRQAAFSHDGRLLAAGGGGQVSIREFGTDRASARSIEIPGGVRSIGFSADDGTIAVGTADSTVRLLHVETGQEMMRFDLERGLVGQIRFSPDGKRMVCFASLTEDEVDLHVWDIAPR